MAILPEQVRGQRGHPTQNIRSGDPQSEQRAVLAEQFGGRVQVKEVAQQPGAGRSPSRKEQPSLAGPPGEESRSLASQPRHETEKSPEQTERRLGQPRNKGFEFECPNVHRLPT